MVTGLDVFIAHFKDHTDKFVLIGGTACDIAFTEMNLDFRATKDLDIVLIVEALDPGFAYAFWEFIKKGGYKNKQKSSGSKLFYRFDQPENKSFPYMLELFSKVPDFLQNPPEGNLTPIPFDDEASSLSAILLDSNYYNFIQAGIKIYEGVPVIKAEFLIPLKAKAYLELLAKKIAGYSVDSSDIKKHRNDILRLYQLLSLDLRLSLSAAISIDMGTFFEKMLEYPIDLKSLRIQATTIEDITNNLKIIYEL